MPTDHNARNREYQREKRKDPAWRELTNARKREYRQRRKEDPEWVARERARQLRKERRKAIADATKADPYQGNPGWSRTPFRDRMDWHSNMEEYLRNRHRYLKATGKLA